MRQLRLKVDPRETHDGTAHNRHLRCQTDVVDLCTYIYGDSRVHPGCTAVVRNRSSLNLQGGRRFCCCRRCCAPCHISNGIFGILLLNFGKLMVTFEDLMPQIYDLKVLKIKELIYPPPPTIFLIEHQTSVHGREKGFYI